MLSDPALPFLDALLHFRGPINSLSLSQPQTAHPKPPTPNPTPQPPNPKPQTPRNQRSTNPNYVITTNQIAGSICRSNLIGAPVLHSFIWRRRHERRNQRRNGGSRGNDGEPRNRNQEDLQALHCPELLR